MSADAAAGTAPAAAAAPAKTDAAQPALAPAVLDKYKAAANLAAEGLKAVIDALRAGGEQKKVLELCKIGDEAVEEAAKKVYATKEKGKGVAKGIAYPTTVSINSTVCNFSPLPSDEASASLAPQDGDVVKIVVGAHIDGYAALSGETIVVGATSSKPASGIQADLVSAAYNAVEAGLRSVKAGSRNWEVTDGIAKVLAEYDGVLRGVEGMVSYQHEQNIIDSKKRILAFPSAEQRRDSDNSFKLEEGEVYHLDILVTSGPDGKTKTGLQPTTIYGKVAGANYSLKMKTSRLVYSEIQKKAHTFPFTLRMLDDLENKARLGVQESVQHNLLKPYDVYSAFRTTDVVAQFVTTFAVTKTGITRISPAPASYDAARLKPDHEIKNEELKSLLARSLKPTKKKTKAKDGTDAAATA